MGDGPSGRGIGRGGVLAVVAVAALAMAASAQARTVVDTTAAWNGTERVCPFGNPDTATYGQVVTVPALDTVLDRFTVYIAELNSGPTLVFRGEVYAWDGTRVALDDPAVGVHRRGCRPRVQGVVRHANARVQAAMPERRLATLRAVQEPG